MFVPSPSHFRSSLIEDLARTRAYFGNPCSVSDMRRPIPRSSVVANPPPWVLSPVRAGSRPVSGQPCAGLSANGFDTHKGAGHHGTAATASGRADQEHRPTANALAATPKTRSKIETVGSPCRTRVARRVGKRRVDRLGEGGRHVTPSRGAAALSSHRDRALSPAHGRPGMAQGPSGAPVADRRNSRPP